MKISKLFPYSSLAKICIPTTKRDYFTYLATKLQPTIGARVWVPFGSKTRLGIMLGWQTSTDLPSETLKHIDCIIDQQPLLSATILELCAWVSKYYQSSLSEVLSMAIPKYYRLGKPPQLIIPKHTKRDKIQAAPILNHEQLTAVTAIQQTLTQYHCFLLHGITGSGKTEVYLHITAKILAQQRQILIIVPEIGLTPQLVAAFTARFDEHIVMIHSHLTEKTRQIAWYQAHNQIAKIVIGTRTAIFTSIPNLGLIIIDEEHDTSLKQIDGVRYSARDTAIMRAKFANIPIILGSATPSLESFYNCQQKKFTLLTMQQRALTTQPLHLTITDLRNAKMQHGLTKSTLSTINEHLSNNEQVLIFINRRGFAPVLLCHQCGWIVDCIACDSHLTLHNKINKLICHHCGYSCEKLINCRNCQSTELTPVGCGTQRLYEFLQQQFPEVPLIRIDKDEINKKNAFIKSIKLIQEEQVQLIVGTQMMAKGHHFPKLTLVVIVDVDCGFYNQDYKALEHLGQLLTQVAGRAGRTTRLGKVIIQTHFPQHLLLNTLIKSGYTAFAEKLLQSRAQALLPPYQFLAVIRAQHAKHDTVTTFMNMVKLYLSSNNNLNLVKFFGPAPAPLMRKANQYHLQILVKSTTRKYLQQALMNLRTWLSQKNTNIRWHIDVDPINLS